MRPPTRGRASRMQTRRPAPESMRAAARPAAPAPMIATSNFVLLFDDLTPGQLSDELHFLVDLRLSGAIAEDAAQVIDLRRHELVVLRKQARRGALKIALRYRDLLRDSFALIDHDDFQRTNRAGIILTPELTVFEN